MNWYKLTKEEIITKLKTNTSGLTSPEVNKRLNKYGLNILPKKETESILKIFFRGMLDPLVILLFITCLFSFLINEVIDAIIILFIIVLDLLLGTFQEWKAEKNADSLSKLIKVKAMVMRDKTIKTIDSENLVIGDIIYLTSGDKVPADIRLINTENLNVNESVLTGESNAIIKNAQDIKKDTILAERTNMVYSGTSITSGRGEGIVVATGLNTEIGKIATSVTTMKKESSPLTIRMNKFSKQISILLIFIAIIISIILYTKNVPGKDIFLSVIALSVSAMPEGLPLALTMALTIGSNKMAQKRVIVKQLNSVESLGSCTVIASDKTGTLTINEQTAKKIILPDGSNFDLTKETNENIKEIAKLGYINNEATHNSDNYLGDSIDIAFLKLGENLNINDNTNIIKRIPYESENGYSATYYEENKKIYVTVKGSIEKVLKFTNTMQKTRKVKINQSLLREYNNDLASDGYRVIAIAKKEITSPTYKEKDLIDMNFLGLVGFIDPVRKEASSSILECKKAGIKVIMITGDHPLTAYTIAKETGIAQNKEEISTHEELKEFLAKGKSAFQEYVKTKTVYTRVTPLDKLEIINALKANGEFVAVTGDGVNDAPALKAANIGISMGSGTDVAKETSTMILENDDFTSIVEGLKEGRTAYNNIRKVTYMLLSCGLAEVLFFVLSIIFNLPMPLLAIQLLWLNLVTDGFQDFALSFEKTEKNFMETPPRNPKESIFNKELLTEILISGLFIGILVFLIWFYLLNKGINENIARGYIMVLMVFIQNIHVLNCRSEKTSAFKMPLKNNPLVIITIISTIILQLIVMSNNTLSTYLHCSPIPFIHLIYLFIISLSILIIMEIYKYLKSLSKS